MADHWAYQCVLSVARLIIFTRANVRSELQMPRHDGYIHTVTAHYLTPRLAPGVK